ncbi:MAG: putative 4-mercaptohistidine N1-methyltransferase [Abditibacteriaceae bacterium]
MPQTYESPQMLADYLLFHYGDDADVMPWEFGPKDALQYPARCVQLCKNASNGHAKRVLDLGCAVGKSTFELARFADEVIGIDYSYQFINAANQLKETGAHDYQILQGGDETELRTAWVTEDIDRSRVHFRHGDACNLSDDLGTFDGALMANLLCRLPDPKSCLERMKNLISQKGWLVIATPASWSEEYTPREKWMAKNGSTLNGIRECLEPIFTLEQRQDLPFVLREHRRKFQWTVAEVSVWRKC